MAMNKAAAKGYATYRQAQSSRVAQRQTGSSGADQAGSATVKRRMSWGSAIGLAGLSVAAGYGLGAMAAASAAHASISYGARVAGRKATRQALQARMTGNSAALGSGLLAARMTG